MQRSELFRHAEEKYRVSPDHPWDDPEYAVLRHLRNKKWFCLAFRIRGDKLGLIDSRPVEAINIKVHPAHIGSLRLREGIFPAYHMNKAHWVTVVLAGFLPDEEIFSLVDESFQLTR